MDMVKGSEGSMTSNWLYPSPVNGPANVFCVRTPPLTENIDVSAPPVVKYVQPCALGNVLKSSVMGLTLGVT